jgi:hypothetical protein
MAPASARESPPAKNSWQFTEHCVRHSADRSSMNGLSCQGADSLPADTQTGYPARRLDIPGMSALEGRLRPDEVDDRYLQRECEPAAARPADR